jgi:type IV pilus assembly protein PilE
MPVSRFTGRLSDAGYTLIEVMITVAIVAILAAIAIPNYSQYVTRSRIIDATSKLGDLRTQMEKFFMDNRTYLDVATGTRCGIDDPPRIDAINAYNADPARSFDVACPGGAGVTAGTYSLRATGRAARGMGGFVYEIDQANNRTTVSVGAGWAGAGTACWVLNKNGSC